MGLGTEGVLTADGFVGTALVWRGAVVHAAAFGDAGARAVERDGRGGTVRSWFHGTEGGA